MTKYKAYLKIIIVEMDYNYIKKNPSEHAHVDVVLLLNLRNNWDGWLPIEHSTGLQNWEHVGTRRVLH